MGLRRLRVAFEKAHLENPRKTFQARITRVATAAHVIRSTFTGNPHVMFSAEVLSLTCISHQRRLKIVIRLIIQG
ncbi:MAG TPA: hypothetical protein PLN69_09480, partial [bacterium]|nr:hypothetical protein [bacterium]